MSEDRLDTIIKLIVEMKEDIGEVRAGVKNNTDFTAAVSKKADDIRVGLEAHKDSTDAHGLGSSTRTLGNMSAWIVAAVAAIDAALHGVEFFGKHGGK